jgi:hypothetical protein
MGPKTQLERTIDLPNHANFGDTPSREHAHDTRTRIGLHTVAVHLPLSDRR